MRYIASTVSASRTLLPGGRSLTSLSILMELLDDDSIVVGSEEGLYQFRTDDERTVHYGELTGYLGIEASVHCDGV